MRLSLFGSTTHQELFSDSFMQAQWGGEFSRFKDSDQELLLRERLSHWAERLDQSETQLQSSFVSVFFKQIWGYRGNGEGPAGQGFTCSNQYTVPGAGATGSAGFADLALGWFNRPGISSVPQALCEFKGMYADLDTPQRRKGNTRSPVKQCADYLREAAKGLYGNEAIQPTWAIVSDMNEFRLYWRDRIPIQFQRFVIKPLAGDRVIGLLDEGDQASFQRFLFFRFFHADQLLSTGVGKAPLLSLLLRQWNREREIESEFYDEYKQYRIHLVNTLIELNPAFPETRGRLVRLAQKLLDRCLFVLFCEDMGTHLRYPPDLLKEALKYRSLDPTFNPRGTDIWDWLKTLFRAMDQGQMVGQHQLNRFNGGLFAEDSGLNSLVIPNFVFCAAGQGRDEETLALHPQTLFFFSGRYNFGVRPGRERAIDLYTLGRIFEQSITELEALEAQAENRPSLVKVTKRKRDGVYYTPEWVVRLIVEETLGARLADLRRESGWDESMKIPTAAAAKSRLKQTLQVYQQKLENIRIVDPACGSGAFLIHSLEFLLNERRRVSALIESLEGHPILFDSEEQTREILSRNIFGVDLNPASVEIAQLAVWLHTARPDKPLSNLNTNIVAGNSLLDPHQLWEERLVNAEERERVSTFDWHATFPEIFPHGINQESDGFDCVVGNPPYVKLQNFKKVHSDIAAFLSGELAQTRVYESTLTGNFDLFLPFIERSIDLLNPQGRMGFIAPSLWTISEYGIGLRRKLHRTRQLDRWVDFKSFQVFSEAMTYTALQFYSKTPNSFIRIIPAPDGRVMPDWNNEELRIGYHELKADETWLLLPRSERHLINSLSQRASRLDSIVGDILVGLQTSADHIFHLEKLGSNLYKRRVGEEWEKVHLEDAVMRPLVSGEIKRYVDPTPTKYILFPYNDLELPVRLILPEEFQEDYPNAWEYLCKNETELRAREGSSFDDAQWYRFGRNQNIDKQRFPKLIVAETVPHLRVTIDPGGLFYLNNVRVNGILGCGAQDLWFVLAALNSKTADFVFRRIAKPKNNGYFEANRQFIAPLSIPAASRTQKREIVNQAQALQALHTNLQNKTENLSRRLELCPNYLRNEDWLFPSIGTVEHWKRIAPSELNARQKIAWARQRRISNLKEIHNELARGLQGNLAFDVQLKDGELWFLINGTPAITGVFVDDREADWVLAEWKQIARELTGIGEISPEKLTRKLLTLKSASTSNIKSQVIGLEKEIQGLLREISVAENRMEEMLGELYQLTPEERRLVDTDGREVGSTVVACAEILDTSTPHQAL